MSKARTSACLVLTGLVGLGAAGTANAGQCRDPWITQAIHEVTGRWPNGDYESGECTYTQYGGGHWRSYAELKGYVQSRLGGRGLTLNPNTYPKTGVQLSSLTTGHIRGSSSVYYMYNSRWYYLAQVIAQGGGNIVSNDGGTVIAQGGGNLYVLKVIAQGGGNIVIDNGANYTGAVRR